MITKFFEPAALVCALTLVCVTALFASVAPPAGVTSAPQAKRLISAAKPLRPLEIAGVRVKRRARIKAADTAFAFGRTFSRLGYDLESVRSGDARVPRLYYAALPPDLDSVPAVEERKALFFKTVLPLVLRANEEILRDRRRLWRIISETRLEREPSAVDRLWLRTVEERYKVRAGDFDSLMARVDVIPVSLALAQAAKESGWGTSRFARQGNAIFGQWTWSAAHGITPKEREEGKRHRVKAFRSLQDSVRDYMLNLNTHRAYRGLREERASARRAGAPVDGRRLARHLLHYSELGERYVQAIRLIIQANKLRRLDGARLIGPSV